jgi:hypothetical protein
MGNFEEERHPREETGKFTAGGGTEHVGGASAAAHEATKLAGRASGAGNHAAAAEAHNAAAEAHRSAAAARVKAANSEKDPGRRSEHAVAAVQHGEQAVEHARKAASHGDKAEHQAIAANPTAAFVAKHVGPKEEPAKAEPKAPVKGKGKQQAYVVEEHGEKGVVEHHFTNKREAHAQGMGMRGEGKTVYAFPADSKFRTGAQHPEKIIARHNAPEEKPEAGPKEKPIKPSAEKGPKEGKAHGEGGKHEGHDKGEGLLAWIREKAKGVREKVEKAGEVVNKVQEKVMEGDPVKMGFEAGGAVVGAAAKIKGGHGGGHGE